MLSGENIVCFSKDWSEDPTSNNHVLTLLSQDNRILWINSISTRTPQFSSGQDLQKIWRKLKSFTKGLHRVNDNLYIFTPIVLPFPHNPLAKRVNQEIMRLAVRMLRMKLGMKTFQLWSFIPTAYPYFGRMGESLSVYYCTDEWSQFSDTDTNAILEMERDLCRDVDCVFTTAHTLLERKKPLNAETHLASHGVSYEHFSKALDSKLQVAPEIANLPRPIVGFFGLIHTWIDQDLLRLIAQRHPDWSVVLIGKANVETDRLKALPNIHLLGRKQFDELPAFCKGFDAGLIPFAINELTHHVNPIKLREYLSAGLPVVSTALPECFHYQDVCTVAKTHDEFIVGLERAVKDNSSKARLARSERMKAETWEKKVAELGDTVCDVSQRKLAKGSAGRNGR
jgi:glycosyltransferase involved in cell wall biosynthesis